MQDGGDFDQAKLRSLPQLDEIYELKRDIGGYKTQVARKSDGRVVAKAEVNVHRGMPYDVAEAMAYRIVCALNHAHKQIIDDPFDLTVS